MTGQNNGSGTTLGQASDYVKRFTLDELSKARITIALPSISIEKSCSALTLGQMLTLWSLITSTETLLTAEGTISDGQPVQSTTQTVAEAGRENPSQSTEERPAVSYEAIVEGDLVQVRFGPKSTWTDGWYNITRKNDQFKHIEIADSEDRSKRTVITLAEIIGHK